MGNNFLSFKEIINSDSNNCILINSYKDSVDIFYNNLIKYYCKIHQCLIKNISSIDEFNNQENDLFMKKYLYIIYTKSSKTIWECLNNQKKIIIFSDYKNFKKYKEHCVSINTYHFEEDLKFFLKTELDIQNKELIKFLLESPEYTYSEIEKILVNKSNYLLLSTNIENNQITEIRKNLFNVRNNIIESFKLIKKEALVKKFNFLTYEL